MAPVIGRRFVRGDGLEKVTGQARYTADLVLPGMLQACVLYSEYQHDRINRIDTSKATGLPGVFAVITPG